MLRTSTTEWCRDRRRADDGRRYRSCCQRAWRQSVHLDIDFLLGVLAELRRHRGIERRCKSSKERRVLIGDCLEILPTLPAASVDMVLADPPYGVTRNGGIAH